MYRFWRFADPASQYIYRFADRASQFIFRFADRAFQFIYRLADRASQYIYRLLTVHLSTFIVMLTVHLSIFISAFNQLYAQNLFHNKFYFTPLHVSSTCAHHQEVKIALHSLWYHHTYRCDDTRGCVMQFWPPDDEHMCSKHVEGWNKLIVKK
jgi:hypothetical protein